MGIGNTTLRLGSAYGEFVSTLPPFFHNFLNLFIIVVLIVIYALFVWKFYRFIGTKNIFKFNFNQYNKSPHSLKTKLIAGGLYFLEYILIIPFIIFFWYAVFTFFLILLVEEAIGIETILLISAIAIAAIRISSYLPKHGENLSKELAKILPFTFLAVSVLNPDVFSDFFLRVSSRLGDLSLFFSGIISYLIFIVTIELILRFFEFAFNIFGIEDPIIEEPTSSED